MSNEKQGGTFGRGSSTPNPPGAPVIHVHGKRVTERDVIAQLEDLGGNALADYRSGKLPRDEAYRMTAAFIRQLREMR